MKTDVPVLRYEIGSTVVPGDRVGNIRQVVPGKGTHVKGGHIYVSVVGSLQVTPASEDEMTDQSTPSFVCSIELLPGKIPASSQALTIGQLVVGRIARITPQNAVVEICVAEHVGALHTAHEGAIRMEDIRTGASEQVAVANCFQPGDLVVCRVTSLGDPRRYFLSTAETELGVIRAMRNGIPMMPISWKEMECPETGAKEPRKCAKPASFKQFQQLKA
jgi:exosome complex component CSL4